MLVYNIFAYVISCYMMHYIILVYIIVYVIV